MFISPVSFTGKTKYITYSSCISPKQAEALEKEVGNAWYARKNGVSATKYGTATVNFKDKTTTIKYTVDGEPADANNNPISGQHLSNLFDNFFKLEEIGLCHKYLTPRNVLYGENGKVEISSMRYAYNFKNKEGDFMHPEDYNTFPCAMPSNADSYERNGLCKYVSSIKDKDKQFDFVKKYLEQKSDYHYYRKNLLVNKMHFPIDGEAVEIEDIKNNVFEEPSCDVVNYMIDKFKMFAMENEAKAKLKESKNAPKDKLQPEERFASVVSLLEVFKKTAELRERAEYLSENIYREDERLYFALEREYLKSYETHICNEARIAGDANFYSPEYGKDGLFLGSKKERKFFNEIFDKIDLDSSSADTCKNIDMIIKFYSSLAQHWTPARNKVFAEDNTIKIISP